MNKLLNYILKKFILFSVGFFCYSLIEVLFRGYTYFTMGLLGGLMLLLVDSINNYISWNIDLLWQGCIGSFMVTVVELFIGELTKYFMIEPMWDYSSLPLNFDGVICPQFSIAWIFVSILGIIVADIINYYIFHEEPKPYYRVCGRFYFTL